MPGQHRRRAAVAAGPQRVDHRDRPPAHREMSLTLTITPHQPANQGSPATKSFMKPSMANSR